MSVFMGSVHTPELAAGEVFRDNEYFDEGDYRIYYGTMSVTLPDGGEHEILSTFRPLRKIPLGYKLYDEDYRYRIVYLADNYTECAIIYSLKGKDKYYNLIMGKKFPTPNPNLIVFDEIVIDGAVYEVEHSSYFVTENCPSGFVYIDGYRLIIGNELIIPNANRVLE